MLLIIVPVIALTSVFAWRYRAATARRTYDPDWDHSTQLELVIWAAPLLIIIASARSPGSSTHLLDPFRPLDRIARRPADAAGDEAAGGRRSWRWTGSGCSSIPSRASPRSTSWRRRSTGRSRFKITSSSDDELLLRAGAGRHDLRHAGHGDASCTRCINKPGDYEGFSANYSGAGFSDMRFKLHGRRRRRLRRLGREGQERRPARSTATNYLELEKPSESGAGACTSRSVDAGPVPARSSTAASSAGPDRAWTR